MYCINKKKKITKIYYLSLAILFSSTMVIDVMVNDVYTLGDPPSPLISLDPSLSHGLLRSLPTPSVSHGLFWSSSVHFEPP